MANPMGYCPLCERSDVRLTDGGRLRAHRQVRDDQQSRYCTGFDLPAENSPGPRSIAHNVNARTGVMLGELRDV